MEGSLFCFTPGTWKEKVLSCLGRSKQRGKKGCVPWWEGRGKRLPVLSSVKEVERKPLFWNPCCRLGRKGDGWELKVWLYSLNFLHQLCLSTTCNTQQLKTLTDNIQTLHVKTAYRFHVSWSFQGFTSQMKPVIYGSWDSFFSCCKSKHLHDSQHMRIQSKLCMDNFCYMRRMLGPVFLVIYTSIILE